MTRQSITAALVTVFVIAGISGKPLRAQVRSSCSASATPMTFGAYDPFDDQPLDGTGNIELKCNTLAFVQVQISAGLSGSFLSRQMQRSDGAGRLSYNVYIDAARQSIWGNGTQGTKVRTFLLLGSTVTASVYGRVAAEQDVHIGPYSDAVLVTVVY